MGIHVVIDEVRDVITWGYSRQMRECHMIQWFDGRSIHQAAYRLWLSMTILKKQLFLKLDSVFLEYFFYGKDSAQPDVHEHLQKSANIPTRCRLEGRRWNFRMFLQFLIEKKSDRDEQHQVRNRPKCAGADLLWAKRVVDPLTSHHELFSKVIRNQSV